jgi:hypothetical protein
MSSRPVSVQLWPPWPSELQLYFARPLLIVVVRTPVPWQLGHVW